MASFVAAIARALILAPHPDDEVLGCGGTIARLAALGCEVHVAILTRGLPPRFELGQSDAVQAEARAAHALLGVTKTHWLDFPAAELDRVAHADLNAAIGRLVTEIAPEALFVPFIGDVHLDHQHVFRSAMVAARPRTGAYPARICAYETLSETNWNAPGATPAFVPNIFVDISDFLAAKQAAFACYRSQVQPYPAERSPETLAALARMRGGTAHRPAAEAFMLVREVG